MNKWKNIEIYFLIHNFRNNTLRDSYQDRKKYDKNTKY